MIEAPGHGHLIGSLGEAGEGALRGGQEQLRAVFGQDKVEEGAAAGGGQVARAGADCGRQAAGRVDDHGIGDRSDANHLDGAGKRGRRERAEFVGRNTVAVDEERAVGNQVTGNGGGRGRVEGAQRAEHAVVGDVSGYVLGVQSRADIDRGLRKRVGAQEIDGASGGAVSDIKGIGGVARVSIDVADGAGIHFKAAAGTDSGSAGGGQVDVAGEGQFARAGVKGRRSGLVRRVGDISGKRLRRGVGQGEGRAGADNVGARGREIRNRAGAECAAAGDGCSPRVGGAGAVVDATKRDGSAARDI